MRNPVILVIDDDITNRKILEKILTKHGLSVLQASSGVEGLNLASTYKPDLIILDVSMPEMDGYEVCSRLQKSVETSHIPIIFLSALSQLDNVAKGFECGAVDYLTKPYHVQEVLIRVKAHINLSRRRQTGSFRAVITDVTNIEPNTVLDEKYRIDEKIGSGGFGTVYKATHLQLLRPVALKIFHKNTDIGEEDRFKHEGISMCRVNHPNAVTIYDIVQSESGWWYIVMELLKGHTLFQEFRYTRTFSAERFLQIALSVCNVLAEAHRSGIIHRDIKPENIFIHNTDREEIVKVLDFGIAKITSRDIEDTTEDTIVGTPNYLAPERIEDKPYDGKSDVYSLGMILYRMVTGQPAFNTNQRSAWEVAMMQLKQYPSNCRELNPELSEELEEAIMSAIRKSPDERPTAMELAEKLRKAFRLESDFLPRTPDYKLPFNAGLHKQTFVQDGLLILPDESNSTQQDDFTDSLV